MPSWPGTLPDFVLTQGYQEGFATGGLLRTEMETGPAKRRNRFTASPRNLDVTLTLTSAQVDAFDSFYETDLAGGAASFDYTHPRTGAAITAAFRKEPQPVTPHSTSGNYLLRMELEILP